MGDFINQILLYYYDDTEIFEMILFSKPMGKKRERVANVFIPKKLIEIFFEPRYDKFEIQKEKLEKSSSDDDDDESMARMFG